MLSDSFNLDKFWCIYLHRADSPKKYFCGYHPNGNEFWSTDRAAAMQFGSETVAREKAQRLSRYSNVEEVL